MKWLSKAQTRIAAHLKSLAKPYSPEERAALTRFTYTNGKVTLAEDGSYEWIPTKEDNGWSRKP